MSEWRDIPVKDIDWHACGVSRRAAYKVEFTAKVPYRSKLDRPMHDNWPDPESYGERGSWSGMTLGELADRGERWWRRHGYQIGDLAKEVIRRTIDMAAEGKPVTRAGGGAPDAYVPKCERGDAA